jgi:undecaprenyl-diphosphatase
MDIDMPTRCRVPASPHQHSRGEARPGPMAVAIRLEQAAAYAVWNRRGPAALRSGRLLGVVGDPIFAGATLTVLALCGRSRALPRWWPALVVASGAAVRAALANRIGRARPPKQLRAVPTHGASLPSKHTTIAALTAGAIVRQTAVSPLTRRLALPVTGLTIGAARVMVGAHWPADAAAGIGVAAAWWWLADRVVGSSR